MRPPLAQHQADDVTFIQRHRRVLLANEPGVGKSRSALTATQDASRVLVVAPSLVLAAGNWDTEIERWADNPEAYQQAPYSLLNERVKIEGSKTGTRPVEKLRPEWRGRWDAVIVDEAHYTKGRKTSWTWAVEQLAKNTDMLIEMTGTPIANWAHELFMPLRAIYSDQAHPGKQFGSFWRWAEQWFDTTPTRHSNGAPVVGELLACDRTCLRRPPTDPCDHYAAFARANLGDQYRRVLRKDCLDLPPLLGPVEKRTPLDAAGKKVYNKLKRDFAATVEGNEVLVWSQGALPTALARATTSPWLLHKEGEPRGGKFEQLRYDLESRSAPTFVVAHYRDTVDACVRVAQSTGARAAGVRGGMSRGDAGAVIRDFHAGRLDVLVGSLETVAEGLTLTEADMAIFVESSFKPSRNEQAKYRIHRMGQTKPCTVVEYWTPDTVDTGKKRLLAIKNDRQMRHLTAADFLGLL